MSLLSTWKTVASSVYTSCGLPAEYANTQTHTHTQRVYKSLLAWNLNTRIWAEELFRLSLGCCSGSMNNNINSNNKVNSDSSINNSNNNKYCTNRLSRQLSGHSDKGSGQQQHSWNRSNSTSWRSRSGNVVGWSLIYGMHQSVRKIN